MTLAGSLVWWKSPDLTNTTHIEIYNADTNILVATIKPSDYGEVEGGGYLSYVDEVEFDVPIGIAACNPVGCSSIVSKKNPCERIAYVSVDNVGLED